MTDLVWQEGDAGEPSTASVRFAGQSLEQVLNAVVSRVRDAFHQDRVVTIVVRDRHGRRTLGKAQRSGMSSVLEPVKGFGRSIEIALDEGRTWRARDVLAVPIGVAERVIGVVSVTGHESRPIDDRELAAAEHAAEAWALTIENALGFDAANDRVHNLEVALHTRAVIEQAKGIVMERCRCDAEAAFEILRARSQHGDVKLSAVAAQIVAEVGA